MAILHQGAQAWNAWRAGNPDARPDLRGADLRHTSLKSADLSTADLREVRLDRAHLQGVDLSGADLRGADLRGADLGGAVLRGVDLGGADLRRASLRNADLWAADLWAADLREADLQGAVLSFASLIRTRLADVDLTAATLLYTVLGSGDLAAANGLESCIHVGPSILDFRTLTRSGALPKVFLDGCGLPDRLVTSLHSLHEKEIQYASCFISHSNKDKAFVERLHADLQASGVRCWYAPKKLKPGDPLVETIHEAIRLHEKLLLVLSASAIDSEWVRGEVNVARAKERQDGPPVLFPVMIDGSALETDAAWVCWLRANRYIDDFRGWEDDGTYKAGLDRLLRDLKGGDERAARAST